MDLRWSGKQPFDSAGVQNIPHMGFRFLGFFLVACLCFCFCSSFNNSGVITKAELKGQKDVDAYLRITYLNHILEQET